MTSKKHQQQIQSASEKDYSSNELQQKILYITQYNSKPYFRNALLDVSIVNPENAGLICDYILAEQTQINIKESTKEGKIKVLIWLSNYFKDKSFMQMTKQDILDYLNSLRKPLSDDPTHKWIGSYHGRQMILNKFFRWLYNPEESDLRKRITPPCMNGIRKLPRQEKSPYKPSNLWDAREHSIFLKYCPRIRDRCYHAMANDMSARPHELLNLKIKDIIFKVTDDGTQYAEVLITGGTTKPRTVPLIDSIPYVKEWIQNLQEQVKRDLLLLLKTTNQNTNDKIYY